MLLRDFVNKKMASADKEASAEGYPLELSNCKKYKPMRDLMVYGNSVQAGTPTPDEPIELQSVGKLVTDTTDVNYGKYKIPIVQRGINLFDKNKVSPGYINDANGEYKFVADGSTYASDYIEIPENQAFYITYTTTHMWAAAYDENKQFVKGIYGYGAKIMPANSKYIRITVRADYIDTMQVQLGSEAAPYEPYVEPVTTNIFLDEPLHKLGDYADYIDFKENKVVRNIKEVVLKGGEINYIGHNTTGNYLMWYTPANYKNVNYIYFNDYNRAKELCTHTITSSYIFTSKDTPIPSWFINQSGRFTFNAELDMFASDGVKTTITDANNWLASQYENGTPVKFCYILATPKEEAIPLEIPKLTAKTTIIEVDTSLAPSNAYGKYIKK